MKKAYKVKYSAEKEQNPENLRPASLVRGGKRESFYTPRKISDVP